MTQAPRFWRNYVAAVDKGRVAAYDASVIWARENALGGGWNPGGECDAYRALSGLTWDHNAAIRAAKGANK